MYLTPSYCSSPCINSLCTKAAPCAFCEHQVEKTLPLLASPWGWLAEHHIADEAQGQDFQRGIGKLRVLALESFSKEGKEGGKKSLKLFCQHRIS